MQKLFKEGEVHTSVKREKNKIILTPWLSQRILKAINKYFLLLDTVTFDKHVNRLGKLPYF